MENNNEEFVDQNIVENLQEIDRLTIALANERRLRARVEAEKEDLGYQYIVLQIYMKYGLTNADVIEHGKIIRGDK